MSLEKLKEDFTNFFAAVKEHNTKMATDHAAKKAAGEPVLNPTFWFIDTDQLKAYAANKFANFGATEPNIGDALHAAQALI